MTEQDWQTCTDPKEMLHFMATAGTSYRKLRLYRCGCLRQIWDHLDFNQRSDVQTGEARADQISAKPGQMNLKRRPMFRLKMTFR